MLAALAQHPRGTIALLIMTAALSVFFVAGLVEMLRDCLDLPRKRGR